MRFLVIILLAYLLYRVVKAVLTGSRRGQMRNRTGVIDEMVQDPQCHTYIPLRQAKRETIGGVEHFFCSEECARKYREERKQK